jgi:hypothetical protein
LKRCPCHALRLACIRRRSGGRSHETHLRIECLNFHDLGSGQFHPVVSGRGTNSDRSANTKAFCIRSTSCLCFTDQHAPADEYSISLEKKKDSEVRGLDLGMEIVRSTGREAVLRSTQSSSWRWQPPHLVWTAPALPHLDAAAVLFLDHVMFSLPRATGPCANASKDRWCSRFISYW